MIVNKPTPEDFEKQSIQYMVQALALIIEREQAFYQDEEELVSRSDFWAYNQAILNNSLTLLFLRL